MLHLSALRGRHQARIRCTRSSLGKCLGRKNGRQGAGGGGKPFRSWCRCDSWEGEKEVGLMGGQEVSDCSPVVRKFSFRLTGSPQARISHRGVLYLAGWGLCNPAGLSILPRIFAIFLFTPYSWRDGKWMLYTSMVTMKAHPQISFCREYNWQISHSRCALNTPPCSCWDHASLQKEIWGCAFIVTMDVYNIHSPSLQE